MYITPMMLEPATASLAVYLLTKTSKFADSKTRRLLIKKPMVFKSKICKTIYNNKEDIIDSLLEEGNEIIIDYINQLQLFKIVNPSIFVCLYIIVIIVAIIA
jgi:hypothetical protein